MNFEKTWKTVLIPFKHPRHTLPGGAAGWSTLSLHCPRRPQQHANRWVCVCVCVSTMRKGPAAAWAKSLFGKADGRKHGNFPHVLLGDIYQSWMPKKNKRRKSGAKPLRVFKWSVRHRGRSEMTRKRHLLLPKECGGKKMKTRGAAYLWHFCRSSVTRLLLRQAICAAEPFHKRRAGDGMHVRSPL